MSRLRPTTGEGQGRSAADPAMNDLYLMVLLAGVLVLLLVYRLSGFRARRLHKELARLRLEAGQETNPRRRQELLDRWKELGGVARDRRDQERRLVLDKGQKARVGGRPLSANPYNHSLWGKGRLWRRGWKSVDRHIRWIEKRR